MATTTAAGRREWIGLGVLALACVVYAMDITVLNLAVPSLSADLRPSSTELLWIVDIYGFIVAGSLLTMGTLGDRIGRRRLLLIGAAAFATASVVAAFSRTPEMLIGSRALLGLAGATLAPSTLSLIRSMFLDDRQRTTAIGIWIASFSAGGAIGPLVGGLVLEHFWWGSVFLLAVPVMALLLVLGPRLLPEFRDPDAGRLDLISAGLSMAAVLLTIYGLKLMAQDGVGSVPVALIVLGLVIGGLFVRRQQTLAEPLIDLRLFRSPGFSASLLVYTFGILIVFGGFLFIAQYLQLVLGLSPLEAGLWSFPGAIAFVVGSLVAPVIVRRVRPAFVMATGLALGAVGFGLLAQVEAGSGLALVVAGDILLSLGLAPVFTLTTDLIVTSVVPEKAGAASGMSETGAELGGAVGIALLGSLGTAIYRMQMAESMPAGMPADATIVARDTLGGAVSIATQLPGDVGAALLGAARLSFTSGLHAAALISAVIAIALASVVVVRLRIHGVIVPERAQAQTRGDVDDTSALGPGSAGREIPPATGDGKLVGEAAGR
jgi:DHA2 family multidrug resistance protein-like MFS transporter